MFLYWPFADTSQLSRDEGDGAMMGGRKWKTLKNYKAKKNVDKMCNYSTVIMLAARAAVDFTDVAI